MKKSVLNLGKALSKVQLKHINGGLKCTQDEDCESDTGYTFTHHYCNTQGICSMI